MKATKATKNRLSSKSNQVSKDEERQDDRDSPSPSDSDDNERERNTRLKKDVIEEDFIDSEGEENAQNGDENGMGDSESEEKTVKPKGRGRPPKEKKSGDENGIGDSEEDQPMVKPKGRGRPSKEKKSGGDSQSEEDEKLVNPKLIGRPPKEKIPEREMTEDNEGFKVEKIVKHQEEDGVMMYKVRWVGFEPKDDSWLSAAGLNYGDIVETYKASQGIEEDDCVVERIVTHREREGKQEFLVHWKGFSDDYDTWEPQDNLKGCPFIILTYKQREGVVINAQGPAKKKKRPINLTTSSDDETDTEGRVKSTYGDQNDSDFEEYKEESINLPISSDDETDTEGDDSNDSDSGEGESINLMTSSDDSYPGCDDSDVEEYMKMELTEEELEAELEAKLKWKEAAKKRKAEKLQKREESQKRRKRNARDKEKEEKKKKKVKAEKKMKKVKAEKKMKKVKATPVATKSRSKKVEPTEKEKVKAWRIWKKNAQKTKAKKLQRREESQKRRRDKVGRMDEELEAKRIWKETAGKTKAEKLRKREESQKRKRDKDMVEKEVKETPVAAKSRSQRASSRKVEYSAADDSEDDME